MRTTKLERGILLVGDDEVERESLARVLQKAGHTVHLAADGKEALRALAERRIQLVISDHDTPAIRGLDLLSLVRVRYPHLCQIALVEKARFDAVASSIPHGETCQVLQNVLQASQHFLSHGRFQTESQCPIWGELRAALRRDKLC